MKQEVFANFNEQYLTIIGLLIFVIFFLVLLIRVYYGSESSYYKYMSELPTSDNNGE